LYLTIEMAAEPWHSIGPKDIFPEEFLPFLFGKPKLRKLFLRHHANLLDVNYWKSVQRDIFNGNYSHVFPYSKEIRFNQ